MKDPIVEEIREARYKHAKQFNFDLHAICEDLKKQEKQYGLRIKTFPPKLLQSAEANNAVD